MLKQNSLNPQKGILSKGFEIKNLTIYFWCRYKSHLMSHCWCCWAACCTHIDMNQCLDSPFDQSEACSCIWQTGDTLGKLLQSIWPWGLRWLGITTQGCRHLYTLTPSCHCSWWRSRKSWSEFVGVRHREDCHLFGQMSEMKITILQRYSYWILKRFLIYFQSSLKLL